MACATSCQMCDRLIVAQNITYAFGVLTINIPAGTYNSGEKYCLLISRNIPATASIGSPVVVTIGSSTTTYNLLKCNGGRATVRNMQSRRRYSTIFTADLGGGGSFKLCGKVCHNEDDTPESVVVNS